MNDISRVFEAARDGSDKAWIYDFKTTLDQLSETLKKGGIDCHYTLDDSGTSATITVRKDSDSLWFKVKAEGKTTLSSAWNRGDLRKAAQISINAPSQPETFAKPLYILPWTRFSFLPEERRTRIDPKDGGMFMIPAKLVSNKNYYHVFDASGAGVVDDMARFVAAEMGEAAASMRALPPAQPYRRMQRGMGLK
jgi:hypothetical protein